MNKELILQQTAAYVEAILSDDSSGHDWWHIQRVWKNAVHIGQQEGADLFIVELAALLHDIDDYKLGKGNATDEPLAAKKWLVQSGVEPTIIFQVLDIIKGLSFKGAKVDTTLTTKEGMVVQDADRLDAIGAIGIGRAFAYGGHKGRAIYDPAIRPQQHDSFEAYKKNTGPTINHFYEKLLLLKDLMNTKTARRIAQDRHEFMEQFLDRFLMEWEGEDSLG